MCYFYRIFGQIIKSNYNLPKIPCLSASQDDCIQLTFHENEDELQSNLSRLDIIYSIPQRNVSDIPAYEIKKQNNENTFLFTYALKNKKADFLYNGSTDQVDIYQSKHVKINELYPVLLGSFAGAVLRLKNIYILHGTTLTNHFQTLTICGESGAGKSTLAAYFLHKGFSLVCDDLTVFTDSDQPETYRSFPSIRLSQDTRDFCLPSYRKLFWESAGNKMEKRYYETPNFANTETVRPNVIVHLNRFDNRLNSPQITEVKSSQKILTLIQQSYGNHILSSEQRKAEFIYIKKLLSIPMYTITQPKDFSCLEKTCAEIMNLM